MLFASQYATEETDIKQYCATSHHYKLVSLAYCCTFSHIIILIKRANFANYAFLCRGRAYGCGEYLAKNAYRLKERLTGMIILELHGTTASAHAAHCHTSFHSLV